MILALRILYPVMVFAWFGAHLLINERAARSSRGGASARTVFDDAIPFIPAMAVFYFSGFILGHMAYLLLGPTDHLPFVAAGYGIQFVVSLALYLVFPFRIERLEDLPRNGPGLLLAAYQRISKPFNSFPSMHVSFCLFSALCVWGFGRPGVGGGLIAWAAVVALSSLLTRQHYLVEVLVGGALGLGAYLAIWAWAAVR